MNIGSPELKRKSFRLDFNLYFSHAVKPLQTHDLCATVAPMNLTDRVRQRLRDEMAREKVSQQELADMIKWTQSRVAQKLTGRTPITLEELDALCFGLSLSPVEAVRDHGLEFCAELAPTELRMLEQIRRLPRPVIDAVLTLLRVPLSTNKPDRYAGPIKKK